MLLSSVTATLPTNVNMLNLTGPAAISGTGNAANDLHHRRGRDGYARSRHWRCNLIGGAGNDVFLVNNSGDVVQDSASTTQDTIESLVGYSLVTNVNYLQLTGTAALTGTANSASDTIASNSGVDTLLGGAGNDTFVIYNSNDLIQDSFAATVNTVDTYVNFSLPANINTIQISGLGLIAANSNSGNDLLVAGSGSDTLIATSGKPTL